MKKTRSAALVLLVSVAMAALAQSAIDRGQTSRGEPWLMGGVGQDAVAALRLARGGYSLSVQTAARRTGAFLADVHLRIEDAQGQPVFDQDLSGPWLLVKLQPGPYTLQASRAGQVQAVHVDVPAQGLREQMFYFDTTGEAPDPMADPTERPPAVRGSMAR
jgi:hypothetical protein